MLDDDGASPWRLGGDAGDVGESGEIICGEPDQVIETLEGAARLGECDVYRGSFQFEEGTFETDSDLEKLPDLRVIEGAIEIVASGVESVHGLERLERVGDFRLQGGGAESLNGLSNLRQVDGTLRLRFTRLRNLRGLEKLRSIGSIFFSTNPKLQSLDGLESLERVRGDVVFTSNPEITVDEAKAFVDRIKIEGKVEIRDR
ncbi:MAG: hypothetical protein ABEN55_10775 [Bradymonadaceae bacterium]